MNYLIVKSLHIIFVVSWFCALFYIVRLFIYHVESQKKEPLEAKILEKQFKIMEYRLWYVIGWPAMLLTVVFGTWMIYLNQGLLTQTWFLLKLIFIVMLLAYHLKCHHMFLQLQRDQIKYSSLFLRFWNEVATIFLIVIVFLVIMKHTTNWIYAVVGLIGISVLLMLFIKGYKKIREQKI